MKVTFVINEPIQEASGGYKMVYTYADELINNGDEVLIVYNCHKNRLFSNYKFPFWIKMQIANFLAQRGPSWFALNSKVKRKVVSFVSNDTIPDADVVIATAADTAESVYRLSGNKGKKYYFVQGYETWVINEEKLLETYKYPMRIITISKWLKNTIEKYANQNVIVVLNGIDGKIFRITKALEKRNSTSICMLYHDLESKGSKEGLKVLKKLKQDFPDLRAHLFGVVKKPSDLPNWIEYTYNATSEELVRIYNNSAIYLCPSWNEGFGLTGAESMMCGCALVSTRTTGVMEYADEDSAIFVDIHDTESMYSACKKLIEGNEKRILLARKGNVRVKALLNYKFAKDKFISILHETIDEKA
ncbi:glycosyltransferase family 4 protein [Clostridium polynesiense]|uniref:glycosyltransferase family 4 protein n=1 Tax=Clostridium polynesiense TaxID=1325933 RepID=UPI000694F3A1|nr:glycosyltransferase family 4 protein [Clostridium polynesiense]